MKTLKIAKSTKPASTPFTRAEFALFLSLLEDESNTDLAKVNPRFAAMLEDLTGRVRNVAYPDAEHWPTDRVEVC